MNPYFEERIVAFIDILGFKEKVKRSIEDRDCAEALHSSLKYILQLRKDNENIQSFMSLKKFGLEITTFSDSIVISYPITYQGALFKILLDIIHLQLVLACNGILIRGGVSIGPLFHDGNIVYGPAMNDAYMLESNNAKMPRVIVADVTLREGIEKTRPIQNSLEGEIGYLSELVREDEDGWYFVDMLSQSSELTESGYEYYEWLARVRESIIVNLNFYKSNKEVLTKFLWMMNYFNAIVTDVHASFPVPEDYDQEERLLFWYSYHELKIDKSPDGVFF